MNIRIGAEYVIANALLALKGRGQSSVSFAQIRDLGWRIQEICNKEGVDAIILTSGDTLINAVYDFSDYFEYQPRTKQQPEPRIRFRNKVRVKDMRERFHFYLPESVSGLVQDCLSEFAA